ncbi:hypothetical protein AB8P51_08925 [Muriicola sp. SD30]|uniref:hypothetical protein n=1 Tax=Muriicola sp. SD30 TaxID=3240936 RepID=UPI00350FEDA3
MKTINTIALLLFASAIFCQTTFDLPTDYVRGQLFFIDNVSNGQNYIGSPYLTDEFEAGKIYTDDKTYPAMMRYNAYADIIEIKTGEDSNNQLSKTKNVWVKIKNSEFLLKELPDSNLAYVQKLVAGDKISLWLRNSSKFNEAKPARSSYGTDKPAEFIMRKTYYIERESRLAEISLKKKDILALFGNKESDMKRYCKEHRLSYSEEVDVVKMLRYFNIN